jgi:hypothetical protein
MVRTYLFGWRKGDRFIYFAVCPENKSVPFYWDPKNPGQWLTKTSNKLKNSMFPSTWDKARLINEIDGAWNSPDKVVTGTIWRSTTPSGVEVEGYVSPRTTIYPIYRP